MSNRNKFKKAFCEYQRGTGTKIGLTQEPDYISNEICKHNCNVKDCKFWQKYHGGRR